jgi:hypothetical protein
VTIGTDDALALEQGANSVENPMKTLEKPFKFRRERVARRRMDGETKTA